MNEDVILVVIGQMHVCVILIVNPGVVSVQHKANPLNVPFYYQHRYDHLRKEASDLEAGDDYMDQTAEPWRKAVESSFTTYVNNQYKGGVCSVYGKSEAGMITLVACIESHQFNPRNYW